MSVANGFAQIAGMFYTIFDPEQGTKPCCQAPDGAIKSTPTSQVAQPFLDFDAVKNYIIPKPVLCNRIVSFLYKGYQVIGYPVNIPGDHYPRNSFTFNLAFIFHAGADATAYESIVVRTAKMMKALEEQSLYLSSGENLHAFDSAMEQMFQDLNNYSECMISVDSINKIDIKLLPILEAPPDLKSYDVPITTVDLASMVDETWDPTLERLLPYINGVSSIRQIADLASADYTLTKKGIQHLVHYGCAVMTSIFQFSNMYAPTSVVTDICNPDVYQEFCDYVHKSSYSKKSHPQAAAPIMSSNTTRSRRVSHGHSSSATHEMFRESSSMLSVKQAFKLYSSFSCGVTLGSWCHTNRDLLQEVDLNRFITFGILKRLIYLLRSYPLWISRRSPPSIFRIEEVLEEHGLSPDGAPVIQKCMSQATHFDEVCTELRASKATIFKVLRSLGDWAIVNR